METTIQNVKEKFNQHARQYDEQRRKLIPCFDDFYHIAVSLVDTDKKTPRVLDIGAGTGLMSSFIRERFPKAKITLIDISEKMLEQAKDRFKDDPEIDYVIGDYTEHVFEETFDIVVSSLSIHHLPDHDKRKLFNHIYDRLNQGGIFINADQVLGHTPFIDAMYKKDWNDKISKSGLSKREIQAAHERTKLDKMATLEDQMEWLRDSGFKEVDCVYKYFNFVVMLARK